MKPGGRDKGLPCSSAVIWSHTPITRRRRQQLPGTNIDSLGQSKHHRSQIDTKEGSHTVQLLHVKVVIRASLLFDSLTLWAESGGRKLSRWLLISSCVTAP